MDPALLALEAPVLSATSLAKVPLLLVAMFMLLLLVEFLIEFFKDCIMLVYEEDVLGAELLVGTDIRRLPSFPSPTTEDEELLDEMTRETCETFPEPENRFFAAEGRADMPPGMAFPVAAASTAEAVTGLFWFEATNTFFPLVMPEPAKRAAALPEATTADNVGAIEAATRALPSVAIGIKADVADEEEEAEEEVLLAVLCLGSICRMSTSGSLIRVAISE